MTDLGATQFGLDTFGDVTWDADGAPLPHAQVLRNVVDEAVLAERVGIDAFSVGEHHRADFAISAPEIVLATIAGRTERIILGTAVTVLSSDDPVRVYEKTATLDAVSGGRAEVTLGRGSFTESFPLFGFDLSDYERLFSEKLDLFAQLRSEGHVSWNGSVRGPFHAEVYPKTERGSVNAWVGVGGSPESVVRAARYGFPLMLAIIGGDAARFAPYVELYHRALDELSPAAGKLPVGVHSPGFVWDTDTEAAELLFPHFKANRDRIGAERGWPPATRREYDHEIAQGSLYAGSPETVARKIARTVRTLGAARFDLKYSNGTMPHEQLMRSIELYGTQVIPRVRELLAEPVLEG
ncbi:LLM class flavin-dependent oxidoreductase [Nocardioides sp. CER19]|uniref:LLM class flavin-dependent oxidoreductase n=1 Tax=Nocardioides sp. CER19 TaxID=3038538 RepID=UPI00244C3A3D|nr:LLM class flavin-dependent oxidoreductase [Nocardioides sp. CER19]MDH2416778.1 LLM class flavin-dependent oxidoreductase [Nocardioides sp. CER19]